MGTRTVIGTLAAFALVLTGCGHTAAHTGSGSLGAGGAPSASANAGVGNLGTGGGASASPGTGGTGSTRSPEPSGPRIVYFKVTSKPACPVVGTSAAPFSAPGQPVTLAWKVTGASGVALSIDDPGFFDAHHTGSYQDYGNEGTVTLAFGCGDTSKPQTTHRYTINTMGGSDSAAKTISVTVPTQP